MHFHVIKHFVYTSEIQTRTFSFEVSLLSSKVNNMEEKVIQDSEKKNDFVLQNSKKIEDRIYYFWKINAFVIRQWLGKFNF